MKNYINQLTEDIEQTILYPWAICTPHFFGVDLANSYLTPPKGLEEFKQQEPDDDLINELPL